MLVSKIYIIHLQKEHSSNINNINLTMGYRIDVERLHVEPNHKRCVILLNEQLLEFGPLTDKANSFYR